MRVDLTPDAAHWVETEVAAGRFPTAEDAVRFAINNVKVKTLSAELAAADREGGEFTSSQVRTFARDFLSAFKNSGH